MEDAGNTDSELKLLEEKIFSERIYEPEKALASGHRMLELAADTEQQDRIYGVAYYCMADASLALNRKQDFDDDIIKAVASAQNAGDRNILARCYNLIAIDTVTQGNYPMAMDNYLKALDFAETKHGYEAGLIYSNIGELYSLVGEYEKSVRYYSTALGCFEMAEDTGFRNSNICICYVEIARGYYLLNKLKEARGFIMLLEQNQQEHHEYMYNELAISGTQAIIYHAIGDTAKSDAILKNIINNINGTGVALDSFVELFNLAEFLENSGREHEFERLAEKLLECAEKTGTLNMQLRLVLLQLRHADRLGNNEEHGRYLEKFYELYKSQQAESQNINREAVNMRESLNEAEQRREAVEQQNRLLIRRSMMDALTGLPNRFTLNEFEEKSFDRAVSEGKGFAIEMLDIDCFKELNDTFGHQKGDRCLQKLAGLLEQMAGEKIFVSRFGGDEFVIIYEDMSDDEIINAAGTLKQQTEQLKIDNPNSGVKPYMTISQGIMNSFPTALDKVWNYLHGADTALYEAKRAGKDTVMLVHGPTKILYE